MSDYANEIRKASVRIRSRKYTEEESLHNLKRDRLDSLLVKEGILNQTAFTNSLERIAKRIDEGNLEEYAGFVLIAADIDDLKGVNDAGGEHKAGDAAIINTGKALGESFRIALGDKIGRRGDEFLVVAPVTRIELGEVSLGDYAKMMMEGSGKKAGRLARISNMVKSGRDKLAKKYSFPENPRSGDVSLSWGHLTRDGFVGTYKSSQQDEDTDFFGGLLHLVETGVYMQKRYESGSAT